MFIEKEIISPRQIEFDYLKGLFIEILLIHSFRYGRHVGAVHKTTYIPDYDGSTIFLCVRIGQHIFPPYKQSACWDGPLPYRCLNVLAFVFPMV